MQNPLLSNICVWITIQANFLSKVSNSCLNYPLRVARKWANMDCFQSKMIQNMNALLNEVNLVRVTLIIQLLKSLYELTDKPMSPLKII
jgi:hypothetical protein